MNCLLRATCALTTAAVLGFSGPIATADVGHSLPPGDPPGEYPYNFVGGETFNGSVTFGGNTATFSITRTSCTPSGDNCKRGPMGFEPK